MSFPRLGKGQIRFLAAVLILLAAAASLYGRGAREETALSRADELIAAKEYDEALRILSDHAKENPDSFGAVQKRLQRIIKLREQYNAVADMLLDTLEHDPGNDERILELIEILLTIESPSNPAIIAFLDQIRYLAEMNLNRNRLENIFRLARARLDVNDFSQALDIYASGLDIYQAEYFAGGYGQEAVEVAAAGLQNINKNISDIKAIVVPLGQGSRALADFGVHERPSGEEIRSVYISLVPMMEVVAASRESFYDIRRSFDAQHAILLANNASTGDRSFLSFAGRLITGPAGMGEGMTGTMDKLWNFTVNNAEEALLDLAEKYFTRGFTAISSRDYTGALTSFDDTSAYIGTALEMVKSNGSFSRTQDSEIFEIYGEIVSEEIAGKYLRLMTMSNAIPYLREVANIGNRELISGSGGASTYNSWLQGAVETPAAIASEQVSRRLYQELISSLNSVDSRLGTEIASSRIYQEALSALPDGNFGYYLANTRIAINNLASLFRTQDINSAIRIFTMSNSDMERIVIARESEFNDGNRLILGIPQTLNGEAYTAYYPSEGLEVLTRLNQNLQGNIASVRALIDQYAAENREVLDAPEVIRLYAVARGMLDRLLNLQSRNSGVMANARTQTERAASLRYEGDRLWQAAQAAMNRNDLATARTSLTRATEQYNASLAVQESSSLRSTWDIQLVNMGAEIVRIENEIVVRDVRDLLNTARDRYFAGNMDQAEEMLLRAQSRWATTNITEQPEVTYWLSLVRGAMSIQSGRIIAATAPLYAEMSQLLSDARRNYDEGVRLLNIGRRSEGLARFSEAMGKTREVRLMFPLNHDARLLELRIEQQTDQTAFNNAFRQRLEEARAGTRPTVRSMQSFAELQDLAEINPRYPGITSILTQAEIDMGFRPPPPDPRNLARSAELTSEAGVNINSRDATRYAIAQTQLEEAIRLNPNNSQAQTLLDQVSVLMRGTGTIVISSTAMDRYNEAVQLYNQGNYLMANAIVQQLLQNPENQRSTQIMELKRRIDAVL